MIEINNKTRSKIDIGLVKTVTGKFLRSYKISDKEISIAFIGDKEMAAHNKKYRGQDKPTDILSFEGEGDSFGELLIDYRQIKRQAKEFSGSTEEELIFILVHGLFHLLGYHDETEEERNKMIRLGNEFINSQIITDL